MSRSKRTAGHRLAASVAQSGQPLGAPLMRRYFNAHAATPYLCFRSTGIEGIPEVGVDLGLPAPGGRELGPLRLVRCPCARSEGRSFRPSAYARTSGAATPIPRSRRAAARVLMDEGWVQCNCGLKGGDNPRQGLMHSPSEVTIERLTTACV
jgi:hypothetical protein